MFRVLFCHGLGCAKRNVIAQAVRQWAEVRQAEFQSIVYGQRRRIWNIDDWSEDISAELMADEGSNRRTLVVSNSAACQSLLRAAIHLHHRHNQYHLEGVLMISPGVGMEVENYMERVMPGSVERLRRGEVIEHPSADPTARIHVNLEWLLDFVENCPTRRSEPIPLSCKVRIIHGLHDKLVPCTNTLKLLRQLDSNDKAAYLVNEGHIINDARMVFQALDSIWGGGGAVEKRVEEVNRRMHN